jgi:O-antigen ligase
VLLNRARAGWPSRLPARRLTLLLGFAYFLLVGGSAIGSLTVMRMVTAAAAGALVIVWIRDARRSADVADGLAITALLIYLLACLFSTQLRPSFDSALMGLAYAAMFGVARRELADETGRRQLVVLVSAIGVVFVAILVFAWGGQWLQWWSLAGFLPPLDLTLTNLDVYWFKYQIAILVGMLAVYSLALPKLGLPRIVSGLLVILSLFLIYISGARSAWLGVGGAVLLFVANGRVRWRLNRRLLFALAAGTGVVVIAVFALGAGQQLAGRLLTTSTIDVRAQIWGHALAHFWDRPFLGAGPGTFPSLITQNGYFVANEAIGRGPDSAVVQSLAEMGLAGGAVLLLLVATVVAGVRIGRNQWTPYGLAAVVVFALSSLTNDSIYSPQLVGLAVVSAALAGPTSGVLNPNPHRPPIRVMRWASFVAAGMVGMGVVMSLAAAQLHDSAVTAGEAGNWDEALSLASDAVRIDPSNGLLLRERGMALLRTGQPRAALDAFLAATDAEPSDFIATRSAALVASQVGESERALSLALHAANLRPADIANLEVLADVAGSAGASGLRHGAIIELLQRYPWLPGAPSWRAFAGDSPTSSLLKGAADALPSGPQDPRRVVERTWLSAAVGRPAQPGDPTSRGLGAILECDLPAAQADATFALPHGTYGPWDTILDTMIARERSDTAALPQISELGILSFPSTGVLVGGVPGGGSPYTDASEDVRLYGSIEPNLPVPESPIYPSSDEAIATWMADPGATALLAAPDSGLAQCSR